MSSHPLRHTCFIATSLNRAKYLQVNNPSYNLDWQANLPAHNISGLPTCMVCLSIVMCQVLTSYACSTKEIIRPKVWEFANQRIVNYFVNGKDLFCLKWLTGFYKVPLLDWAPIHYCEEIFEIIRDRKSKKKGTVSEPRGNMTEFSTHFSVSSSFSFCTYLLCLLPTHTSFHKHESQGKHKRFFIMLCLKTGLGGKDQAFSS